ncbi:MAG: hypothetical protein IPK46_17365 [Saprospiraceae bacterium]|nr:hypothetical protein [Saprospiraceae bacterium]
MPIAYDPDLALNYIKESFQAMMGLNKEYIDYYNNTGNYSFDENSSDEELAVAIINRISIGFTLKTMKTTLRNIMIWVACVPPTAQIRHGS